jgi:DNA-binding response OmpR family regulator
MTSPGPRAVPDDEVFAPTEKGNRELKSAGTSLSVAELEVLVLVDGMSSFAQIAEPVPGESRDDIVIALRQQPPPDLILLDVQLPDVNGFDVLAGMRHHPVLKSMPVIMLTAETTREAVLKGLQGGADGYVTKPFEPDILITAVKTVLGMTPAPPAQKA